MKKIAVIRHAERRGSLLSSEGQVQANRIGVKLSDLCEGKPYAILTSDEGRTILTGSVITQTIGREPVQTIAQAHVFASWKRGFDETVKVLRGLSCESSAVIVVTHAESVAPIVWHYAEAFGITWDVPEGANEPDYCSGFVIDLETKTIAPISHE